MLLSCAVPIVGVAMALAAAVSAPSPGVDRGVDVVPVLTSTPFGATAAQTVTHTITLSGAGTGGLTAVRLTFTTTVGLDGVTVNASQGSCPVVAALTVVCELGNVDFRDADTATPKVTISGTVKPGTAPGTLVQNLVNLTSQVPDADTSNNVVSNAYLVPEAGATPIRATTSGADPARSTGASARGAAGLVPVAAAALVLAGLAAAGLILLRRRRS